MNIDNYPQVTINESAEVILDAGARPTLMLGPPGIGKSQRCAQLAGEMGKTFAALELGLTVPEEVGGIPARDQASGRVVRLPLGPIAQACSVPTLLLVDEVTRADAVRQGAAMTGVNERRWGDYVLHPETVVVLAGNEPESGGTHSILDALLNRCCVIRVRAEPNEVRGYLRQLGPDGSELRRLGVDYAATSEARPQLIQCTPPVGFAESGALWASPRAIEHGLTRLARRHARTGTWKDELAKIQLAGCISNEIAATFFTILSLRSKVPSDAEIVANPATCTVPTDTESAIAVMGLVALAAEADQNAAWLYAGRISKDFSEVRSLITRRLTSDGRMDAKAFAKNPAAFRAYQMMLSEISSSLRAST